MGMLNKREKRDKDIPECIETPTGIFTVSGNWFFTTEKQLKSYAPELFKIYRLSDLIQKSERWIKSTDIVGIILSMILLITFPLISAVLLALFFGLAWNHFRPAFYTLFFDKLLRPFSYDIVLLTAAVIPLSFLGITGLYLKLICGMLMFLIFKFGWFRKLADRVISSGSKIPLNDRILNMVIVRHCMKENIALPAVSQMESDILQAVHKSAEQRRRFKK